MVVLLIAAVVVGVAAGVYGRRALAPAEDEETGKPRKRKSAVDRLRSSATKLAIRLWRRKRKR